MRARAGLDVPPEFEALFRHVRVVRDANMGTYRVYRAAGVSDHGETMVVEPELLFEIADETGRRSGRLDIITEMALRLRGRVCIGCGGPLERESQGVCPGCITEAGQDLKDLLADLHHHEP